MDETMKWHDDGHYIRLRIWKSEVEITEIFCPDMDEAGCIDPVFGCVVKHFIGRYGLDCNAGTCLATDKLDLCWTLSGDKRIIEECQLWFMPKTDEVFATWLDTRLNQNSSE
jgi:hypothetical protein